MVDTESNYTINTENVKSIYKIVVLGDSDGFISGIATVAGSAIFNALIIPSLMALVVFFKLKKSLNEHNNRIILRDGAWL